MKEVPVGPKAFIAAIMKLAKERIPLCVMGPPGVGKSDCARKAAESLGIGFEDVRLTTMDPVDLRGLPVVSRGKSAWTRPEFLPSEGEGILLLDEIGQASQSMQAAAMQLVLDRRIGPHEIAPGWAIIAATNRAEDRAGAGRIITPLLNRFVHIDLEPSVEDWLEWAQEQGVDARIRGFVKSRPELLLRFDPSAVEKAWPTPRSWAAASRVMAAMGEGWTEAVRGTIGQGAGMELEAFIRLCVELPDAEVIWESPETAVLPKELSLRYAVGGILCDGIKDTGTPRKRLEAFGTYAARMGDEAAVAVLTDGIRANRDLASASSVTRFLGSRVHLFVDVKEKPKARKGAAA